MKGKLKHSLKERCPICGKVLQLRTLQIKRINKGLEVVIPEDKIFCSSDACDYERFVEQKRKRSREDDFISPL
jgi:hypothetical protein